MARQPERFRKFVGTHLKLAVTIDDVKEHEILVFSAEAVLLNTALRAEGPIVAPLKFVYGPELRGAALVMGRGEEVEMTGMFFMEGREFALKLVGIGPVKESAALAGLIIASTTIAGAFYGFLIGVGFYIPVWIYGAFSRADLQEATRFANSRVQWLVIIGVVGGLAVGILSKMWRKPYPRWTPKTGH